MTHDDHGDDHPPTAEPVLVSLSAPARRSLVAGLVRAPGATAGAEVVDVDIPDAELAAHLVRLAHADHGFVARTAHGPRAVAVVAATVAALCGEDIPTALTAPDLDFLRALKPPAIEATRTVLLAVETDDEQAVTAALRVLDS
ncbi:hypothetical protein [Nocardia asteroides]|nr:hypothetical protein [Nocardia asteroides]TLF68987.1 hypothetical protein FEK33_01215 [Nocardia asteroides NBRC 15531]UGT48459.1 hypothetical protein LT345_29045 [Nocardia asteroides]SFL60390.1 hypothetical protein SAMN05444423_101245 [Nocardia asteroides]VEG32219.1 Uncharacterised protein [Nocardia asteroides]